MYQPFVLACAGSTKCEAVDGWAGTEERTTNAGASWATGKLPAGEIAIETVACPSVTTCVAVGETNYTSVMSVEEAERGRIGGVDGVRALAFLLVFVYHTGEFAKTAPRQLPWGLRQIAENGNAGVDIFIVVSGFCLFLPIVKRPERFRSRVFFRQRARRIMPAYYVSILYAVLLPEALVVVYRVLNRSAHWQGIPDAWQLITHLTFTQTFFSSTWAGINGSYWSLGLEAEFYVTLPLLALAYRRLGPRGLAIPIAVSVVWNGVLFALWGRQRNFDVIHFLWGATAPGRWIEFGAGMVAAWLVVDRRDSLEKISAWLGWIGIALILVDLVFVEPAHLGPLRLVVLALGSSAVLISVAVPSGRVANALNWHPLSVLGLTSYSFYLLHQPTEYYFSQFLYKIHLHSLMAVWALELTVGFAIVAALSAISYRYLESRYLRERRHQHNLPSVT